MQLTRGQWAVFLFSLAYIVPFTAYYVYLRDFEFLWYVAVLLGFLVLVVTTVRFTHFSALILWGLSIWGLLHMAGGGVPVGEGVLYQYVILDLVNDGGEFVIFKFDQLVHAFGFGVATLVAHHLLRRRWQFGANNTMLYVLAALVGMGLGSINEIVEFAAVLAVPETGVGGYYNTALDLVFNALGATCAAVVLAFAYRSDSKNN